MKIPTFSFFGSVLLAALACSAADTVVRVTDINPGGAGSYPSFLTIFNNQLFFRANSSTNDVELWKFDGTNALRVADVVPGPTGSSPANLAVLGGALYFNATTPTGYRVWRFNGTNAVQVAGLNPPYAFFESAVWKPVAWNGWLYYPSGGKMYLFNGSQFSYLNTPPWAQMHVVLWNGALYYGAQDAAGVELWRYDGAGQTRVTDINPGAADGYPEDLFVFRNQLVFRAQDGVHGAELWSHDGTSAHLVSDIYPGGNPPYANSSNPSEFAVWRNNLYFSADDGVHGYELFRYDGTNVTLAADVNPNPVYEEGGDRLSDSNPRKLTVWNDRLYFVANSAQWGGLWCHDGTNTALVGGGALNEISELLVCNGKLYFDADDGVYGRELWRVESNPSPKLELQRTTNVQVRLNAAETGTYVVEASDDLVQWKPISTNSPKDGQITIQDNSAKPTRMYRVVKP